MIILAQVHLLRGQSAPANEYLCLIKSLLCLPLPQDTNQSSSDIFEFQALSHYLTFLQGKQNYTYVLEAYSSMVPSEESVFSASSIGLYYLLKTFVELGVGDPFKSLITSRNALVYYEKSERTLFIYSAMVLRGWSHLYACRLDDCLQIGSDASLYATISQGIPLTTHKWAMELLIVTKILRGDFHAAQADWEKLQPISRHYLSSPTSCALLAILNVYKGGPYLETVPYCRYACLKLSEKQFTSPVAPLFLFYAAYAALRIIEFCKMEVDSEFHQRTERAYDKLEIHYPDPFSSAPHPRPPAPQAAADACSSAPPSSSVVPITGANLPPSATAHSRPSVILTARSTKKFCHRDPRSLIDLLIPCVNLVIRKFESSQQSMPICQVFGGILSFMKKRILTPTTNLMPYYAILLKQFAHFEYFSIGLYYFHYEAAIYLSSKDNKQAQMEADQSFEMVKKLMTATSNVSSNSPHHSSEFSVSPAKIINHVGGAWQDQTLSSQVLNSLETEEDNVSASGQQQPILETWSPSRRKKNETKLLSQIVEAESISESKEESKTEVNVTGNEVHPFISLPSGRARRERQDKYLEEKKEEESEGFILTQFSSCTPDMVMAMEKS